MGQAGAQREPSMEEILASIRKIIENNDPVQDEDRSEAGDGDHAGHSFANDHMASVADDRREDESFDQDDQPAAQTVTAQTVTLAEVAALARATSEAAPVEPQNTFASEADVDAAAAEELREALLSDEPVESPVLRVLVSERPEQVEQTAQAPDVAEPEEPAGQLVSLHTGEKVAASFGELDAAIAAGQNRSFDEIAEEMLRPMLTQWLDDNLPTLVERLVREEIERVSRGNRR